MNIVSLSVALQEQYPNGNIRANVITFYLFCGAKIFVLSWAKFWHGTQKWSIRFMGQPSLERFHYENYLKSSSGNRIDFRFREYPF